MNKLKNFFYKNQLVVSFYSSFVFIITGFFLSFITQKFIEKKGYNNFYLFIFLLLSILVFAFSIKLIVSLKFGITNIFFIVLFCVLSTLIPQTLSKERYVNVVSIWYYRITGILLNYPVIFAIFSFIFLSFILYKFILKKMNVKRIISIFSFLLALHITFIIFVKFNFQQNKFNLSKMNEKYIERIEKLFDKKTSKSMLKKYEFSYYDNLEKENVKRIENKYKKILSNSYEIINYVYLNKILNSSYFHFLFILLSISLFLIIIKKMKLKNIPFLLIHSGILIVFLYSMFVSRKILNGVIEFSDNQKTTKWKNENLFLDMQNREWAKLPFEVRFRHFKLKYYKDLILSYPELERMRNFPKKSWIVKKGLLYNFSNEKYSVKIKDYIEDALVKVKVTNLPSKTPNTNPLMHFQIKNAKEITTGRYVLPYPIDFFRYDDKSINCLFYWCKNTEEYNRIIKEEESIYGNISINIKDKEKIFKVIPEKEYLIENYTIKIKNIFLNYKEKELPVEKQNISMPGIIVSIKKDAEEWEDRIVFSGIKDWEKMHEKHKKIHKDISVNYFWNFPINSSLHLIKVITGDNLKPYVIYSMKDKVIKHELLVLDKPFDLFNSELQCVITRIYPNGYLEYIAEKNTSNESNFSAVNIEFKSEELKENLWLISSHENDEESYINSFKFYNDEDLGEIFFGNNIYEQKISSFESFLEIYEKDELMLSKLVKVNFPLVYKNYWFYQSGYDKNIKNYTQIKVVYIPYIIFLYIGFIFHVLGLILIFFKKIKFKKE